MNIISCHVFDQYPISTVILTCPNALVLYIISKGYVVVHGFVKSSILTVILKCCDALVLYIISQRFLVIEIEIGGIDNISISVNKTNATNLHEE